MKKFFLIILVLTAKLCCEEKVDWEGMMSIPPEELFQDQIEMYQTTKFITNISELSNKLDDLAENVRELRQIIMDNALSSKERFDFEIRITALECENNKLRGEVGFHEKLGQERIAAMNYMISELENKNILLDQKDIMVNQEREENRRIGMLVEKTSEECSLMSMVVEKTNEECRRMSMFVEKTNEEHNQIREEHNHIREVINQKDQVINQKDEEIKKLKEMFIQAGGDSSKI